MALEAKIAGVIHALGALGDRFGNQQSMKIDQSVEDTVILLSQFSCITFGISKQFRIVDMSREGFNVDPL